MPMFHLLKVLIINVLHYKYETWNKKYRLKVNIMYDRKVLNAPSSPAVDASSPGPHHTRPKHLRRPFAFVKARCLDKQIQYIFLLPSWGIEPPSCL